MAEPPTKRHRGERWGTGWREGKITANLADAPPAFNGRKRKARAEAEAKEAKEAKKAKPVATLAEGAEPEKSRAAGDSYDAAVKKSEALAKAAIKKKDFSLQTVLRVLRAMQVPATANRKNVMPDDVTHIHGMLLGLYTYMGSSGVTSATTRHPFLTRLLISAMRREAPDFPFTSVQLNYGYASKPHVDKNNLGTSFIIGLGEYEGGELWVHDESGDTPYVLEATEDVTGYYRIGRKLAGTELAIQNVWTVFDGNKLHYTKPFTGERYSLIFFTSDKYASTSSATRRAMTKAGFDFDFRNEKLQKSKREKHAKLAEVQRKIQRERQELEKQRVLLRGRCMGRVWAKGWGLRCTAACEEDSEFCGSHLQMWKGKARWKTHGRIDGDLPKAKKAEMLKFQKEHLKKGRLPPCLEGATILVKLSKAQQAKVRKRLGTEHFPEGAAGA